MLTLGRALDIVTAFAVCVAPPNEAQREDRTDAGDEERG